VARLRRVATGGVVLLTTSVFVVFSVALFNLGPVPAIVEAAGSPPLDNSLAWTREDARSSLSTLGDGGRGSTASCWRAELAATLGLATAAKLVLIDLSTVLVVLGPSGVILCLCTGGAPQGNQLLLAIPRRPLAYEPVRISGPSPVSTKVSSVFAARSEGFQANDWPSAISCRVSDVATISCEA
jgi:hypothetical protein